LHGLRIKMQEKGKGEEAFLSVFQEMEGNLGKRITMQLKDLAILAGL